MFRTILVSPSSGVTVQLAFKRQKTAILRNVEELPADDTASQLRRPEYSSPFSLQVRLPFSMPVIRSSLKHIPGKLFVKRPKRILTF